MLKSPADGEVDKEVVGAVTWLIRGGVIRALVETTGGGTVEETDGEAQGTLDGEAPGTMREAGRIQGGEVPGVLRTLEVLLPAPALQRRNAVKMKQ